MPKLIALNTAKAVTAVQAPKPVLKLQLTSEEIDAALK